MLNFNSAATAYDKAALVQECVASWLVDDMAQKGLQPRRILDMGCGTGFVLQAAARHWPEAELVGLDSAPTMLTILKKKMPQVETMWADATKANFAPQFDLILSSMMLHWLPQPEKMIKQWQSWLNPDGALGVTLLTAGSFQEWKGLCAAHGAEDAVWPFPAPDIFMGYDAVGENLPAPYDSAYDFIKNLKKIGAARPHPKKKPLSAGSLRAILKAAPQPFAVTYKVLKLTTRR